MAFHSRNIDLESAAGGPDVDGNRVELWEAKLWDDQIKEPAASGFASKAADTN